MSLRADVPVCVVGVRTSGSYLAPLFAAALRSRGMPHVEVLTHRPHRDFLADEVDQLQRVCGGRGRIVIIDDPPGSGASLATTATAVARAGVADDAIVVAVCLFPDADGDSGAARPLGHGHLAVGASGACTERMSEPAVADTAGRASCAPGCTSMRCAARTAPTASRKAHVRGQYVVTVRGRRRPMRGSRDRRRRRRAGLVRPARDRRD